MKLKYDQVKIYEAKRYFKMKFIISFVLLLSFTLSYFYIFCCENSVSDDQLQRDILLVFLPTLATILISAFLISSSVTIKEYPPLKKIGISLYVILMVFIIVFQLLSIVNTIPLSGKVFKICVILFVLSLFVLILYVLIFIHSNVSAVLTRLFRFSVRPFIKGNKSNKKIDEKIIEETKRKIAYMGHLIIHATHEHDIGTYSMGIEKLNYLGKIILESPGLNDRTLNNIYKNIISNYQYISCECAKVKLENYMMQAAINISDLIEFGMTNKSKFASKIDYPILIIELEKAGMMSVENNMPSAGREIIGSLGQIGEMSLNKNLDIPPEIQVLSSLQEIGIMCAAKKLENLCIETLVRIDSLGRESAVLIEPDADSKRKEEIEKIFKKTLSSHWIVSAYMFKHIPESGEWLKKSRDVLEQDFGDSFGNAYNHALNDMELISSIGVKVLMDYEKAVTKK